MFKSLLMLMSLASILASCNPGSSSGRGESSGASGGTGATNGSAPVVSALPSGVLLTNVKMTFDAFKVTPTIFVRSTAENVCLPFKLTLTNSGAPLEGATVALTKSAMTSMKDMGEIVAVSQKSSAAGIIEGTYCSGDSEGSLVIAAELSGLIANSETIRVTVKPIYKLEYSRSDIDPILTPSEGVGDSAVLYLNLVDSGPQDCTSVYFKLSKSGKALTAAKVTFRSQIDFPAGAKFAKKADAVKTSVDALTRKKYLTYESYTNTSGEAAVPVCAGVFLGSVDVAATFVDDDGKSYETHSPIVRIVGGLTNWINMSLMFDEENGRTLRGYFNTNSKYSLPITANIGSRMDGMPIKQYPLMVAAETGRVTIENGGFVDADSGTVKFTVQALHTVDNYPYAVYPFGDNTGAQTRCHPAKIAEWGLANSKTFVNYSDVAKNWRSTIVYYVRGQEHYHDANGNGKYDEGGDGFWDRNQNGYYDSEDVLTYDAGNDGKFDRNGEWFIDLPTPFIDVDEDRTYTPGVDILIGEKYEAPNGKRDADTTDWKYEILPISMGPSDYALQHYRIDTSNYQNTDATAVLPWGTYNIFGVKQTLAPSDFWATPAEYGNSAFFNFAVYAHDICGSLLPGGTTLTLNALQTNSGLIDNTSFNRQPALLLVTPPEDRLLEPSRRLFKQSSTTRTDASESTSGTLNFNAIDHPSKDYGYPITGRITIPACVHQCSGAVNATDPGTYCNAWQGYVFLTVTEPALASPIDESFTTMSTYINLPKISACKCIGGSSLSTSVAGTCSCPSGQTFNGTICQ